MFSPLICPQLRSRCTGGSGVGWEMLRRAWAGVITKVPSRGCQGPDQETRTSEQGTCEPGRLGWPEGGAFLDNLK